MIPKCNQLPLMVHAVPLKDNNQTAHISVLFSSTVARALNFHHVPDFLTFLCVVSMWSC